MMAAIGQLNYADLLNRSNELSYDFLVFADTELKIR